MRYNEIFQLFVWWKFVQNLGWRRNDVQGLLEQQQVLQSVGILTTTMVIVASRAGYHAIRLCCCINAILCMFSVECVARDEQGVELPYTVTFRFSSNRSFDANGSQMLHTH